MIPAYDNKTGKAFDYLTRAVERVVKQLRRYPLTSIQELQILANDLDAALDRAGEMANGGEANKDNLRRRKANRRGKAV